MKKSCGPFKVAYILNQCLDRLDHPEENLQHESSGNELPHVSWADSGVQTSSGRKSNQGRSSPAPITRLKDHTTTADSASSIKHGNNSNVAQQAFTTPEVLIVDDNTINRNVGLARGIKDMQYSHGSAPCSLHEATQLHIPRSRKRLGRIRSIQEHCNQV